MLSLSCGKLLGLFEIERNDKKSYINIEEIIMTNIHLIPIDLTFFIYIKFIILIKFST